MAYKMLTNAELAQFRGRYADEFGPHERIVRAMRREDIDLLRTEGAFDARE